MSTEKYDSYDEARTALLSTLGITGKARVQPGVIRLYADLGSGPVYITGDRRDAAYRAVTYAANKTPYWYQINPAVFNK